MTMPFYVAPEQFMKDKADFARKNIGRGRPLVATVYAGGVLICAENFIIYSNQVLLSSIPFSTQHASL